MTSTMPDHSKKVLKYNEIKLYNWPKLNVCVYIKRYHVVGYRKRDTSQNRKKSEK